MGAQIQLESYPIHSSVKDKLHPEYVAWYNKYLLHQQPAHQLPISVSRAARSAAVSSSDPLPVGTVQDLYVSRRDRGPDIPIRCFIPEGAPPSNGWPLVLYFHGGGWVFGNIDSENTICTHICVRARAVVITTEYRLAPESPWPGPVHDAWEALLWATTSGRDKFQLDLTKIAVGGSSAGANIAAVLTQNAVLRPQPGSTIVSQFLIVPVTDNTATPCSNPTWKSLEFTAALPAEKMLWYRRKYLPDSATWSDREASPLLACDEIFRRLPTANIIVAGLDVLKHEGEEYARKLRANGVSVELTVMDGMPHPFPAMDAVLEAGKSAITITCDSLSRAFA
ncbi:alpha/beta hydrolase fold-domain-containing protein [Exophiala viscosa]|uniref:alpha/beta hydrolase fold-domain-containing protein n=1 Tax=Exophiala viscosa TaxID=2486360 RepID=UPI00219D24F3|nr:alpha/beta hydrolase fold-domain-containing protein [Exophiala viscosa]